MTLVTIDLKNVGSGTYPTDKVIFYSPVYREAPGGGITSTAETVVPLVDGVGEKELTPGPVTVTFQCRGISDTRPKSGIVPNDGPVTLNDVIENSFTYSPPVVSEVINLRDEVRDIHDAVEQSRDEIVEAAVRIGTAEQVGLWATQASEAADRAENSLVNKADLVNGKVPSTQIPDVSSHAPVQSVNGQTGTVNLGYGDVGAAPASHTHTSSQVDGLDAELQALHDLIHARHAFFSGEGAPVDLPYAVVGDYYFDKSSQELHEITGV